MLFFIRKWIAGWFAAFIVLIFCLPLLLFGTNYYFTSSANPVIAKSSGVEIKLEDFRRALSELRQRYRTGNVPLPPEGELRESLLWSLIDGSLVLEYAKDKGMRISAAAVIDVIRNFETLQQDGVFDRAAYNQLRNLVKQRLGADIEDNVRAELVPLQLQAAVTLSSFLLEDEVLAIARINAEQRDFAYATLSLQEAIDEIEVEQEQVEEWFRQNEDRYHRPQRVQLAYLEVKIENLREGVEVEEESLEAYYNGRAKQYDIDEKRRVSHLYQPVPSGGSDAAWVAAKEKINGLRQRLLDNKEELSMEQIAEDAVAVVEEAIIEEGVEAAMEEAIIEEAVEDEVAESVEAALDQSSQILTLDDTDAAAGDEAVPELPDVEMLTQSLMPRTDFMPEMAEVAFAMAEGDISDVVETANGIHILRLDEISEGRVSTFENSRADVESDYRDEQAALLYLELAEELATLAYENPDNLEQVAETLDLELQHSDWLEENGSAAAPLDNPQVQLVAFSEEVLENGLNSELLELSPDHAMVLRVELHEQSALKEFSEVEEQAESDLRRDIASKMVLERGEEILHLLQSDGSDAASVAVDNDFAWDELAGLARESEDAPRNVLREVFRMTTPVSDGRQTYLGKETGSGDYLLVRLDAVNPVSDDSDIEKEKIDAIWQEYSTFVQRRDWGIFMQALRAEAEVQIFQDRIDEAFGIVETGAS